MRIKLNPVNLVFYLLLITMVLKSANGHAQKEFVIKSVNTQLNETVYFLNAVFEINLPDFIVEAFEQGFEIPLSMEIEISRKRGFWFDEAMVTIKQQYRIQYHAMLDSVSMLNVNSGNRLNFSSLEDALNKLTVLLNFPLLDNNALIPNEHYSARLNFGIDNTALPTPLKSSSLWENDWHIGSNWYEWDVTQ
jgi:hypothetical protein